MVSTNISRTSGGLTDAADSDSKSTFQHFFDISTIMKLNLSNFVNSCTIMSILQGFSAFSDFHSIDLIFGANFSEFDKSLLCISTASSPHTRSSRRMHFSDVSEMTLLHIGARY